MNIRQRHNIAIGFDRLLKQIERRYIVKVFNALKNQLSSFTNTAERHGIEYARRRLQSEGIGSQMTDTIRQMHIEAGLLLAGRTLRGLKKSPVKLKGRGFGNNEQWRQDIIEFFRLHLLESVDSVSETTKQHILAVLERGFNEGWSIDQIVRDINDREYMKGRAETIVRTESVRAANFGVFRGADTYEFEVVKEWVAVNDRRTRVTHRHGSGVDGEQRDLDKPFSNGLQFPGDPTGPGKETINCRCSMAIVAKRDENGRLIPKVGVRRIPIAA